MRTNRGRRGSLASSTATRAAAFPRDVQSVWPFGPIPMWRAGPGTRVRQTTLARSASTTATSSLAESVTYASDARGCTAAYRGAAKPSSSARTRAVAASTSVTTPCSVCATSAIRSCTDSMLRGPGPVLMCRRTRVVSRSSTTTWLSRSAVTYATGVPPRRAANASGSVTSASEPDAETARKRRLSMPRIRDERTGKVPDLSRPRARISVMDLRARFRRSLGTRWPRVVTSAPTYAARNEDRPPTSRPCFAFTGLARTALRTSSRTTPRPRRTSPRRRFLAAIRALDRFDRRRPFGPWLHRIVVNRAIDWTRARRLRAEVELSESLPADRSSESLGDDTLAALARLSPEHRAVIVMRYLLEFTPGEIADALDLPRGTVNSRLRRGLDALEVEL